MKKKVLNIFEQHKSDPWHKIFSEEGARGIMWNMYLSTGERGQMHIYLGVLDLEML